MKLKNYLKQLQRMLEENPKLGEYVVLHRAEAGVQEGITHVHTEGRTIITSSTWAEDILNPEYGDAKEAKKLRNKITKFKTDEEMAFEEVTGKPMEPPKKE